MEQTFLVKTISKKTIEVAGRLIKKPAIPKAPLWFVAFEKKIDDKFEKIDQRLEKIHQRIDNLVKVNNLKEA